MTIFFVHIPKCGGKSLKASLSEAYGDDLQLYYNNPIKSPSWKLWVKKAAPTLIRQKLSAGKNAAQFIYGHYALDDFKIAFKNKTTLRAAFFRDPVEWVGSYALYAGQKHPHWFTGNVLEDIKRLRLDQAYSTFLGSTSPEDLDFVGLVEEYDQSLGLFEKITGTKLRAFHENKTQNAPTSYHQQFEEKGILPEIEELMKNNKAIYAKAQKRYQQLCEHHKT